MAEAETTAPQTERMSRVDTAWLRMDNDVNLKRLVGVWLPQPGISYEALAERITDKLLKYERFRQKMVQDTMGANWVVDDDFDVSHHAGQTELRQRAGQGKREALQELVDELTTTPLHTARPLWQGGAMPDSSSVASAWGDWGTGRIGGGLRVCAAVLQV